MLTHGGTETGPEIRKPWEKEQLRKGPPASSAAGVEPKGLDAGLRNKHVSEAVNWRPECLEICRYGLHRRNNGRRQLLPATVSGGGDAKLPTRNWTVAHRCRPRGPGGTSEGRRPGWGASASFPDPGARVGARGRLGGLRRKARRQDH